MILSKDADGNSVENYYLDGKKVTQAQIEDKISAFDQFDKIHWTQILESDEDT